MTILELAESFKTMNRSDPTQPGPTDSYLMNIEISVNNVICYFTLFKFFSRDRKYKKNVFYVILINDKNFPYQ